MALKKGTRLEAKLTNTTLVVDNLLSAGGQGEVYKVLDSNGKLFALKWYNKKFSTLNQRKIILDLIEKVRQSPILGQDRRFVFPLDIVESGGSEKFGYLMELLNISDYPSGNDYISCKIKGITLSVVNKVAYNLVDAFAALHTSGLVYADINFSNVHLHPKSGDIKILDNDNVVTIGEGSGIAGTADFKAPELVLATKINPDANTDRYSLAILLFYLFFRGHPLHGKKEADIAIFDIKAQKKIYGKEPVFIYDENDNSNLPVKGVHDSVIHLWKVYPQFLKNVFIKAFSKKALDNPGDRVYESEWKRILCKLNDSVIFCYSCRAENFYDLNKLKQGNDVICWHCSHKTALPYRIKIDQNIVNLNLDTCLYFHHMDIRKAFDFSKAQAIVIQNPNDPKRWGLKNLSSSIWQITAKDGSRKPVEPGKSVAIKDEVIINFGSSQGKIKK